MGVRPALHIAVLTADADRFHGALTLAAAEAALGGRVTIFLQLEAVGMLASLAAPGDAARSAHGLPTLAELVDEALDLGVVLLVCQSGLALAEIDAAQLEPRIEVSGPVAFLSRVGAADRFLSI